MPLNNISPVLDAGDITSNAILKIAKILNRTDRIPNKIPSPMEKKINNKHTTVGNDMNILPGVSNTELDKVSSSRVPTTNIGTPIQKKKKIINATWKRGYDTNPQLRYNLRLRQIAQSMTSTRDIVSVEHKNNYRAIAGKSLLLQQASDQRIAHIYNAHGDKQSLDNLLKKNPTGWSATLSNEWGRLSNGNDAGVESTDTLEYIFHHEVQTDKR